MNSYSSLVPPPVNSVPRRGHFCHFALRHIKASRSCGEDLAATLPAASALSSRSSLLAPNPSPARRRPLSPSRQIPSPPALSPSLHPAVPPPRAARRRWSPPPASAPSRRLGQIEWRRRPATRIKRGGDFSCPPKAATCKVPGAADLLVAEHGGSLGCRHGQQEKHVWPLQLSFHAADTSSVAPASPHLAFADSFMYLPSPSTPTGTGDTMSRRRSSSWMTAAGGEDPRSRAPRGLVVKKPPEEELKLDDDRWTRIPENIPQPPSLPPPLVCLGDSSLFWFTFDHGLQRAEDQDATFSCLYKCLRRTAQGRTHLCLKERNGKEGAGVTGEEEGMEQLVVSLSSMPFLGRRCDSCSRPLCSISIGKQKL